MGSHFFPYSPPQLLQVFTCSCCDMCFSLQPTVIGERGMDEGTKILQHQPPNSPATPPASKLTRLIDQSVRNWLNILALSDPSEYKSGLYTTGSIPIDTNLFFKF
ncbi:unnamed protein product [Arabidopsis thaliana]|uniref:Uncharacterized protein n=1 Tax=Arabidopsis thaliana TaxID=3702 RepID=A0A654EQG0_ARATH|nr:unnamed protein product [Arabidopsis thaliana]